MNVMSDLQGKRKRKIFLNAPNADPQQLRQDRRVTHYLQDFWEVIKQ